MTTVVLRSVEQADLPLLFEHQADADAAAMAAFPSRDRRAFDARWAKTLADETAIARTIVFEGEVAGNIGSWLADGRRLVGYWIGREFWGKGVATAALAELLREVRERPLYAHVAAHNVASIRVLEKCGFVRASERTDGDIRELLYELPS